MEEHIVMVVKSVKKMEDAASYRPIMKQILDERNVVLGYYFGFLDICGTRLVKENQ